MHRPFIIFFILFLLNLALAGCTEFQARGLEPSESASQLEQRTLSNHELMNFIRLATREKSINATQSWNLDRLTLAAIFYHPDLAVARAQTQWAAAGIKTAGQRPNPFITISPTWVRNLATAAVPWIAASSIGIPIETAGKRDYRIEKASQLAGAARLRIADTAWLVRGRLRAALLETFAAEQAARFADQQLAVQQAINQRLEQQLAVGEIGPLEISRSHLALNQAKLNADAAQKRVAESKVTLATAIGIPVDGLANAVFDFNDFAVNPALQDVPVGVLKTQALHTRPDILAALADYEASQAALQLEIANQYPNLQANPGYSWEMGEHRWTLGSTLPLPLFHQNQGPIAEAEAKRTEMAARFEALQMKIIGDIDHAHAGVAALMDKWRDSENQVQTQKRNSMAMQAQYQAGETDRVALLSTELEQILAERARLDVRVETQQALNGLEDTLRRPLHSVLTSTSIAELAAMEPKP
ncbi:TolC family protein [Candidatus Methylobacter oryzae]|uniref:TolC family protein n=1 Tax=Candidatus Methylobacter oryzae TaxID=2497749 RepID=A0ABY3C894_9GAMM|nr:TolC family protein [Candidatus Methylobacter oryzae]TRW89915.1 TolC family protein [Candidatus Methylobacter oryzae]